MATRAERYRYEAERAGPKRPKRPKMPPRNWPIDTSMPGVSATDRRVGGGSTSLRNVSARAASRAPYRLENSETGRPPRKSTRKSANRLKNDRQCRAKSIAAYGRPRGEAR
jgi:hypothetical protein